ncbi:MAG: sugar ABC transporter ATP-binding protein [Anaerolineae bacterium]|nr:sugar ABC transporter ATP-binding protein [Anaerolineae bacterium]
MNHIATIPDRDYIVRMEKITKKFGTITALSNVDFGVERGEVRALLGDNGAGKSTLIKILMGVHQPTSGQIYFEGKPVVINSPREARAIGIEAVYQDLALVNLMSISRNFFLGREMVKRIGPIHWLDIRKMNEICRKSLHDIGIEIRSASERVGSLSGGERQSVAIGRGVYFGAKVLILDEPTSALSVAETRKVLTYIANARERGLGVIFITHNVHHVYMVADSYTVIRHGQHVGTYYKGELGEDDIADLITGDREY